MLIACPFEQGIIQWNKETRSGSYYKLDMKKSLAHSDEILCVGINLISKRGYYFLSDVDHQDLISVLF